MHRDIEKIFFTEEDIAKRVRELGKQISADYAGKNPVLIGVLKGAFVFMADLLRALDIHCQVEFVACSSYGAGTETSGTVTLTKGLSLDIKGRDVIIVEDILDSGVTINFLKDYLLSLGPASVKVCTFLDKPARRKMPFEADYVGYTCEDAFVVGYGLDYAERYRNLPYIGVLKQEVYA
ncbi:MAG: hypoxanthine phosphoribosyltransferase [Clostridiales bacterium]|nr:hypoxanthine phosphoribosyltransferase [Clostridiales bacterium]